MVPLPLLPAWAAKIRECRECHKTGLLHREAQAQAEPLFFDGNYSSKLLLVAEAPNNKDTYKWGRLTVDADKDPSGEFLRRCLRDDLGLAPEDVMLTNSVLCLPARSAAEKYPVTRSLRRACAPWLKTFIDKMNPTVVATLGAKALHALKLIEPHRLRLKLHVGQPQPWYGRVLMPLGHPSRLGRAYRCEKFQHEDYIRLRATLEAEMRTQDGA